MKITRVETLETPTYPNLLWVQLYTDDGLIGLGETFSGPRFLRCPDPSLRSG